jgi:hypothetical protein
MGRKDADSLKVIHNTFTSIGGVFDFEREANSVRRPHPRAGLFHKRYVTTNVVLEAE